MRKVWIQRVVMAVLLLAGLLVRIHGAWDWRHEPNIDRCRVGLMTKHISEGREFPVFFYGGAYMGTPEPAVSALIRKLSGTHGFALNLGTALIGFLLLPLIYLWARSMGGYAAGLVAVLLWVVGPPPAYYYMVSPLGGYAVTLVAGMFVLWRTAALADREWDGERVAWYHYALLGAVAGVAWWSNQLIFPYLVVAGSVLLLALRGRVLQWRILSAVPVAMVTSAPWWIWNLTHDWATFQFTRSFENPSLTQGLHLLFTQRLPGALGVGSPWSVAGALLASAYGAVGLICLWVLIRRARAGHASSPWLNPLDLVVAVSFITVFALVFGLSHFAHADTDRYALPLVPVLVVLAGVAFAGLWQFKAGRPLALLLLAVLLWGQSGYLRGQYALADPYREKWDSAQMLADLTEETGLACLYGGITDRWINFASEERCCVVMTAREGYAPYEKRAELAEDFGLLGSHGRVTDFLAYTRASFVRTNRGPFTVHYDIAPPASRVATWDAQGAVRITDAAGRDRSVDLTDGNTDTGFRGAIDGKRPVELTCQFETAMLVAGIRLFSAKERYPGVVLIEGKAAGDDHWRELLPAAGTSCFFFSGPRVYAGGLFYRPEYRFAEPARVEALRVRFPFANRSVLFDLAELEFLIPATLPPPVPVSELVEVLQQQGVTRVYCDRWLSHQIRAVAGYALDVPLPAFMARGVQDCEVGGELELLAVGDLAVPSAFVLPAGSEAGTRAALASCGVTVRAVPLGGWVILMATVSGLDRPFSPYPGLLWCGFTCYRAPSPTAKRRADWYVEQGVAMLEAGGDPLRAEALLRRGLEAYANHVPGMRALAVSLNDRTDEASRSEGASWMAQLGRLTSPGVALDLRFGNGARCTGLTVERTALRPGDTIRMAYLWQCPPGSSSYGLMTFVHFTCGDHAFSDDHPLLEGVRREDLLYQPFEESFIVERSVRIPHDTPAGDYRVGLGVYRPSTGERLKVRTRLPHRRGEVALPVVIRVRGE